MSEELETVNAILREIEKTEGEYLKGDNADNRTIKKLKSSLSTEYKSIWNDVNIQGDYDQYARSAAPSRRILNGSVSQKKDITTPRSKENESSSFSDEKSPRQRKARIKLKKPELEIEKTDNSQPHLDDVNILVKGEMKASKEIAMVSNETKHISESSTSLPIINDDGSSLKTQEHAYPLNKNLHQDTKTKIGKRDQNNSLPNDINERESNKICEQESRNSNKSIKEFTPPIVTAANFGNATLEHAMRMASKNDHLFDDVEKEEDYRTHEDTISRLSTLFMANYLGVGFGPSPNVIKSIVVKPILPPLRPKQQPTFRKRHNKQQMNLNQSEVPIIEPKSDEMSDNKTLNASDLPPLKDGYAFRRYNTNFKFQNKDLYQQRNEGKRKRYHLLPHNEEAESMFEHIVRWRSKARHCGKPAMYRRITSPTLGEVALRRKLTDRLPTRQIRRVRPDTRDLQPRNGQETWRRPRSRLPPSGSVKQFIKHKIQEAHQDGSLTSPGIIEGFYDVTNIRNKNISSRMDNSSIMMSLPQPEMQMRKMRPVWQRLK